MSGSQVKKYKKITEKKVAEEYNKIVDDAQQKFISDILSMPKRDRWKFAWLVARKINPWEWSRKQIEGEV